MKNLYIGNDNVIEIDEPRLTDSNDDSAVTTGTVTWSLKLKSTGVEVSGGAGSLTHVSGGLWRGEIPASVSLTAGVAYTLEITAASSGKDGFWRVPCVARYRQ